MREIFITMKSNHFVVKKAALRHKRREQESLKGLEVVTAVVVGILQDEDLSRALGLESNTASG